MEILSKTSYYEFHPVLGYISLIIGLVFAVIVLGLIIDSIKDENITPLFLAVGFSILAAFCIFAFVSSLDHKMVYEYKVTITDFNEVHEKGYEIIDQEGKIYTVTKNGK